MVKVVVLGSGSRGNCTFVQGGRTRILIDAGFSRREIERRLAEAQAQEAQQKAQDPVVQMQMRELELEAGELQRKIAKDRTDAALKQRQQDIEMARIASQEKQAGARIGLDAAAKKEALLADLNKTGAQLGVQIARDRMLANRPAAPKTEGRPS